MINRCFSGWRSQEQAFVFRAFIAVVFLGLAGCTSELKQPQETPVRLTVTTTVRDSGLLEPWIEWAQSQSTLRFEVLAMSSGQAADLVDRRETDLVMLHAPAIEQRLIDQGLIAEHQLLMRNDFVLIGPADDPAEVRGTVDWVEAMKRIAISESQFASRGDRSGTHQREEEIWQAAGIEPGSWRLTTGLGQAETLRVAGETQAYAIVDRATLVTHRELIDLVPFDVQGDFSRNEYRLMLVEATHRASGESSAVQRAYELLGSKPSKAWIDTFGVETFGESLFQSMP